MNIRLISSFAVVFSAAQAGELKKETLNDWAEYLETFKSATNERLKPGRSFLWTHENQIREQQVRSGQVLAGPADPHVPRHAASGLIHHWIGAAFIPDTRVDDVIATIREYDRYKDFYPPVVLSSKALHRSTTEDRFSVVLMNKSVLSKIALETDCRSTYFEVDPRRRYSISESTSIQEIENYGQPSERKLPPDEGSGYIWRLHSVTRFEERDGGVYLEIEALALTRDIPVALRWIVDPIVRRVSKSSLLTSLRQTEEAVGATVAAKTTALPTGGPRGQAFRQK
jgi:hypothetical protein